MKKLSFLALAAAGLMMVGCADKDEVAQDVSNSWNGEGEGYMSLTITMPQTPVTRAANDVFDDGLPSEYKVSDAILLLFAGEDESKAKCISAQELTLPFDVSEEGKGSATDNLTSSYQVTAKVTGNMTADDELFALVALNYKNVIDLNNGNATIGENAVNGKKLSELLVAAYQVAGNAKFTTKTGATTQNYFFMINSPLQYANGAKTTTNDATTTINAPTAAQIKTLAWLDKSKIKRTAAEAKADPAGSVYVERAVAKATLSVSGDAAIPGTIDGEYEPIEIGSVEWAIDNIEPSSYVIRNMGDLAYIAYSSEAFDKEGYATPYYRMVGNAKIGSTPLLHPGLVDIYRTYWCVDPQYDAAATGLLAATTYGPTGTDNPQYCNENTFNVANQLYKNTTRAVIKVTPKEGTETFYTVNGAQERYNMTDAESYLVKAVIEHSSVMNAFKAVTKAGKSFEITKDYFTIECEDVAATGKHQVKSVTLKTTALAAFIDPDGATGTDDTKPLIGNPTIDFSDAISDANSNVKLLKYTDGVMYYEARFQHFANTYFEAGTPTVAGAVAAGDLAPWNFWEAADKKPTSTSAYPAGTKSAEENYLGRWGMVRNNWYDVEIGAFNKIGSPVDPSGNVENPDYPDDNLEDYISVKIHVLSWAKRTQQWSF